jgi:hypothetical protein
MQYTREEKALTETTTEPEPQPEVSEPTSTPPPETEGAQPETQEQEITAIVPISTEPEVIEGEFVEIEPPEDHTPPKQKPYWLLIPLAFLLCLSYLGVSYLLPLFSPSATVTILPVERTITTLAAIQVQGRSLPPLMPHKAPVLQPPEKNTRTRPEQQAP